MRLFDRLFFFSRISVLISSWFPQSPGPLAVPKQGTLSDKTADDERREDDPEEEEDDDEDDGAVRDGSRVVDGGAARAHAGPAAVDAVRARVRAARRPFGKNYQL